MDSALGSRLEKKSNSLKVVLWVTVNEVQVLSLGSVRLSIGIRRIGKSSSYIRGTLDFKNWIFRAKSWKCRNILRDPPGGTEFVSMRVMTLIESLLNLSVTRSDVTSDAS